MIQSRFIRRIQLPGSPGSSKPLVRTRKKRGCVIYVCSDRCCQIYLQRKISERKHCNVAITRAAKKLILLICAMVKIRQAFYKTAWLFLFCNTPCEHWYMMLCLSFDFQGTTISEMRFRNSLNLHFHLDFLGLTSLGRFSCPSEYTRFLYRLYRRYVKQRRSLCIRNFNSNPLLHQSSPSFCISFLRVCISYGIRHVRYQPL